MNESSPDPFEHARYRRLFAWGPRLEREAPLLREVLSRGPNPRLLDLGCGSGEHAAFLQDEGFSVTGIDASARQVESAREHASPTGPFFVQATIAELGQRVEAGFGGALCLGNVLPYLDDEELDRSFAAVASVLESGAPWLIQVVNYPGLRARGVRHLPVNVRPGDETGEELVLLRLLRYADESEVIFSPITLRWPPAEESPAEIAWSRSLRLRAYTREQLIEVALRHGFEATAVYGSVRREEFDPVQSHDLVLHLTRS